MKRCKKQWSSSPFADYKNFAIHIRAQNKFWMVAGREYLRASRHLLLHTGNTNTRQWNFCSIKTSPLSDRSKIWAGKKVNWTLCNILFVNIITEIKSMIYRFKELAVCSRMRVSVTGRHDRQVKFLALQVAFLAGHYPLISHYFEPCTCNSK